MYLNLRGSRLMLHRLCQRLIFMLTFLVGSMNEGLWRKKMTGYQPYGYLQYVGTLVYTSVGL